MFDVPFETASRSFLAFLIKYVTFIILVTRYSNAKLMYEQKTSGKVKVIPVFNLVKYHTMSRKRDGWFERNSRHSLTRN